MRAGNAEFLVEVDDQVAIPKEWPSSPQAPISGMSPGYEPIAAGKDIQRNFKEVQDVITECCNGLLVAIDQIPKPSKVTAEFGVKLGGEMGVPLITKITGEANFKITVEWQN